MKGNFFIKARKEGIITEHGVRAFVMEKLLKSGFERGAVIIVDDKTLEIRLEGVTKGK